MRKINSFTFITLNGFFKGPGEDTSWHQHGGEAGKFANKASSANSVLLFGRKTYEMMANFWPTPAAAEMFPTVAANMNKASKIVFSNSLKNVHWNNTQIVSGNMVEQVKKLKQSKGNDMTVLGSGSIITQLTDAGLIDHYTIMLDPVALDNGTSIFSGIGKKLDLKLISSKVFKNDGIVLLNYDRIK